MLKEDVVVLISDEEIRTIFTKALHFINETKRMKAEKDLQIYHPKEYRGCESSKVMCVGVEDSWVVEAISRAIRNLIIVDGGTHPAAQSRMGLWWDMERKGLLKYPQPSSPSTDFLNQDHWKTLNETYHFLKV